MLGYSILAGAASALVITGIVLASIFGAIKAKTKKARQVKQSTRAKQVDEIRFIKDAIMGLARNAGQIDAEYIKMLTAYDVSDETILHVLKASKARQSEISDKELRKLDKSIKKSI